MQQFQLLLLIFFIYIGSAISSYAKKNSYADNEPVEISNKVMYFIDSTNRKGVDEIKALSNEYFYPTNDKILHITSSFPIWVRIPPGVCRDNNLLALTTSMLDSIVLYSSTREQYQGERILNNEKSFESALPIFSLPNGMQTDTVHLKFIQRDKIAVIDLRTGEGGTIVKFVETRIFILSGFLFLMLTVFVFNVAFYLFSKSKLTLSVCLFNLFTLIFITNTSGLAAFLPFEYAYHVSGYTSIFLSLLMMSGIFMSITILNIQELYPTTFKILAGIFILALLCIFLSIMGYEKIASTIVNPLGGFIIPIYIITSYKAYKAGQKHAIYYLIGWICYYVVLITIILAIFRVIPTADYFYYLTPSVSLIDFFLISATVISKINTYRIEKERIEKEQLRMIREQKDLLEIKVSERTKELQILNSEIASQNKELISQKEIISDLNDSLERKVKLRTLELEEALHSLELRNKDLENFSYVISHNLRGPVSTILGLTQIYNFEKPDDPGNADVITYTKKAILTLDRVIKDLNYIISLKKATPEEYSEVNFEDVYQTVCLLLEEEISRSNAIIHRDFHELTLLHSVPAYWQNILYNLLSNSIKYSRSGIHPIIHIKTSSTETEMLLTVSDNGTGMDFSLLLKEKIFKLFQRGTNSREGRGVGLYLVKTHVELLGGTIDVESKYGQGTTFYIEIPFTKTQQLS